MSWSANLWLYFVMVFGIIALPGMDMAFVSASTLAGGLRSGVAALAGIVAGGVCHTVMGALGIAVILTMWPALFQIMAIAGAIYFVWIGWSLLRAEVDAADMHRERPAAPTTVFRRAMMTCLLNPKAYLFMFAIFPQFLKPAYGPVWIQAATLGAIGAATQIIVYSCVALMAYQAKGLLGSNPTANRWMMRSVGLLFLAMALLTGVQGWRG